MLTLRRGRYLARLATGAQDLDRALMLRARGFGRGAGVSDRDAYDAICHQILVEHAVTGDLVGCFRLLPLRSGMAIGDSYAAQHYDLTALSTRAGPMLELGRFCIAPEHRDPDILRLAWGAITALVDAGGVEVLFGCSSFAGVRPDTYRDAFGVLRARHLAPDASAPRIKSPDVVRFATDLSHAAIDPRRAVQQMPPLLRTYLAMGGWVSDHAVIDRDLGTLHVFTGLEIGAIPAARARALRAIAAGRQDARRSVEAG
ncbi:MAG: GNAT family N-acyltransferase [Celeribacter sp.]|jgi:putative hemolysin